VALADPQVAVQRQCGLVPMGQGAFAAALAQHQQHVQVLVEVAEGAAHQLVPAGAGVEQEHDERGVSAGVEALALACLEQPAQAVRGDHRNRLLGLNTIALGLDFAAVITQAVSTCEVLLAVIGPTWLTATDQDGQRRLEDPDDIVRLEIAAALERDIRVIPILVEGTQMPRRQDLPEALAKLARRNALSLRHESFRSDADRLVGAIEPILRTGITVGPGSSDPTPLGVEQVQAKPLASSPTRLDERQFLRSLDSDEYREALRGLFETAKAVGMVFEWGSVGSSIRLHTPDRDEPLTVVSTTAEN
jgi:hypothetical protein